MTLTVEELAALEAQLVDKATDHLAARLESGETTEARVKGDLCAAFGMTDGAMLRAVHAYAGVLPDPRGVGLLPFVLAHGWGEMAAMRRVKLALSDPRARGRALEVVEALEAGASIEAALTAPQPPESDCGAVVIPLCPKDKE